MSKPIRCSNPAARPVSAIPTTPPAGPDRIASLPWNRSAAVSPPDDIMNMRRVSLCPAGRGRPGEARAGEGARDFPTACSPSPRPSPRRGEGEEEPAARAVRSEERRVGKEGRSRGAQYHWKRKLGKRE